MNNQSFEFFIWWWANQLGPFDWISENWIVTFARVMAHWYSQVSGRYKIFSISICFSYLPICYPQVPVIIFIFSLIISCMDINKYIYNVGFQYGRIFVNISIHLISNVGFQYGQIFVNINIQFDILAFWIMKYKKNPPKIHQIQITSPKEEQNVGLELELKPFFLFWF